MITANQLLARARSALGQGTMYWLDAGGLDPEAAQPATGVAVAQAWAGLDAAKQAELAPLAAAMQIDLHDPGLVLPSCDCSGFVCWALGFSRRTTTRAAWTTQSPDRSGAYWTYTGSIYADALAGGVRFRRVTRANPGALVVYPKDDRHAYGHIAIVVAADASGRATQIIHCSKDNVAGSPHDAIKITGATPFDDNDKSVYVWCRDVADE